MLQTVSIVISGKVQGVYFRQSAKEKALELGLSGIVKNEQDGTVHIVASGKIEELNQLIAWCKKGPARAVVYSVNVQNNEPLSFIGFNII